MLPVGVVGRLTSISRVCKKRGLFGSKLRSFTCSRRASLMSSRESRIEVLKLRKADKPSSAPFAFNIETVNGKVRDFADYDC